MKKLFMTVGALILASLVTACGQPVEAGYVGVRTELYGSNKGVQSEEVGPGRYMIGWNERLYVYPTFTQTMQFCTGDEADAPYFTFQTGDGAQVTACVGISASAKPDSASLLLQKFRATDREPFDNILRSWVYQRISDELNAQASSFTAFELTKARIEMLKKVQDKVAAEAAQYGIIIEKLSWISPLNYPANVQRSINDTLESVQKAEKAKQDQFAAEAQAKVTVVEAQAQADRIRIEGESIRQNPQVLQMRAIEKWDGQLPQVTGAATPFVNISPRQE